jgi:hypothetical protein
MSDFPPHPLARIRVAPLLLIGTLLAVLCCALAAPRAEAASSVERSLIKLQQRGQISKHRARWAAEIYRDARTLSRKYNKPIKGRGKRAKAKRERIRPRRVTMRWQVAMVTKMAREGRINKYRIAPLFTTLDINTRWFRRNGPAAAGTDRRFGDSRIIFQYFPKTGWQFHPLSNFARLNAIWTVDDAPSRRAQRSYARELIKWGVPRRGALTWEYYFNFSGSKAPWVSSISQGTAAQSLARVGYRMRNRKMLKAAKRAANSFGQSPTQGIRLSRDGGYHFLGYSGAPRLIILNMFVQSLNSLRSYSLLTGDKRMRRMYIKGVQAAKVEAPKFDTGSWSLYSLSGEKSDMHYHLLTIEFMNELCKNTRDDTICGVRDRFKSYVR